MTLGLHGPFMAATMEEPAVEPQPEACQALAHRIGEPFLVFQ